MTNFIHGDNLEHKISIERNPENKKLLEQIKAEYLKWKESQISITGATRCDIKKRVDLLKLV